MNRPKKMQGDTQKKVLQVPPRIKPTWNFWNQRSNPVLKWCLKNESISVVPVAQHCSPEGLDEMVWWQSIQAQDHGSAWCRCQDLSHGYWRAMPKRLMVGRMPGTNMEHGQCGGIPSIGCSTFTLCTATVRWGLKIWPWIGSRWGSIAMGRRPSPRIGGFGNKLQDRRVHGLARCSSAERRVSNQRMWLGRWDLQQQRPRGLEPTMMWLQRRWAHQHLKRWRLLAGCNQCMRLCQGLLQLGLAAAMHLDWAQWLARLQPQQPWVLDRAEIEDPIEEWSLVSSEEDAEEVPPDVKIHRDARHEAMHYITAGVKGKYKGKLKGKVKGDPDVDEAYLRELQRAEDQQTRIQRMERQEELYGPVRGEPESSSSSSYPTETGTSYPSGTGTSSGTRATPTLAMTSEDGVESFELEGDSSGAEDHTLEPGLAAVPEDRMAVMYGQGGFGKNPAATSATGAIGLQPEVQEGHPAEEVHGQDGQQAPAQGGNKTMTLHLVGGGGKGGKDRDKGHGKKGKDQANGHGKKGKMIQKENTSPQVGCTMREEQCQQLQVWSLCLAAENAEDQCSQATLLEELVMTTAWRWHRIQGWWEQRRPSSWVVYHKVAEVEVPRMWSMLKMSENGPLVQEKVVEKSLGRARVEWSCLSRGWPGEHSSRSCSVGYSWTTSSTRGVWAESSVPGRDKP